MRCRMCLDILNRLGVDHECDGQTDERTCAKTPNFLISPGRLLFHSLHLNHKICPYGAVNYALSIIAYTDVDIPLVRGLCASR